MDQVLFMKLFEQELLRLTSHQIGIDNAAALSVTSSDSDLCSCEDERSDEAAKKRVRYSWELLDRFATEQEAMEYLKTSEMSSQWTARKAYKTLDGQKVIFRCSHDSACRASIYMLHHERTKLVLLFRNNFPHEHDSKPPTITKRKTGNKSANQRNGWSLAHSQGSNRNWGLFKEAKTLIRSLYELGVTKPADLVYAIKKEFPESNVSSKQISNYIHYTIKCGTQNQST